MTINRELFASHNLYPVRIGDYLTEHPFHEPDEYILYGPLHRGSVILLKEEELRQLSERLERDGRFADAILSERLIADKGELPMQGGVSSPKDVYAITILPNNICNFSCSYCYAAKGHGSDEMSDDTLRSVLDFFVDPQRLQRRELYISFGGGGEPLLSWKKMLLAMQYSTQLAEKHGFDVHYSFASNGSVISDEIISALKRYQVKTNISFDILESVQNLQRRNYKKVCRTLDLLLENDIIPTINSVITPHNVAMQCDMVREVHNRFPKLRRLSFDYVVDGKLFDNPEQLRRYFDEYTDNFYKARKLGLQLGGIDVSSIKHHNLFLTKSRACAGGFDVNAHGDISMCFFVSSPKEKLYSDFIYGHVADGKVEYDEQKFKALIDYSANTRQQCRTCFLRWHCGGGCLFQEKSYSTEMIAEICRFQRKFSLIELLDRYDGAHKPQ